MTTQSHDEMTTLVETPPQPASRRRWPRLVLAGAIAMMLVFVGALIGRATASGGDRADPFDLEALANAWGSGDADQIRSFYTDDAVMVPFGQMVATLDTHPMPEYWEVSGDNLNREAAEHHGGTFQFIDAKQIGNMVVATGQWTFPSGLFPNSANTVIKTTDIMHLRDRKIWRHFTDFEVYVDGELINM